MVLVMVVVVVVGVDVGAGGRVVVRDAAARVDERVKRDG